MALMTDKLDHEKDAVLYQPDNYIIGATRTFYFPEVSGSAQYGDSPWEGWNPGEYISVYESNEEKVRVARLQVIRWERLNKFCVTKVIAVYGHFKSGEWRYIEDSNGTKTLERC